MVKNPPENAGDKGDLGLTPGYGRPPGGGHGNPLQHSRLENPMDGGAWQATVHGVPESWTRLKQLSTVWYFVVLFPVIPCLNCILFNRILLLLSSIFY